MVDAKKFRITPDVHVADVNDEDVIFRGKPLNQERIASIVEKVDRSTNLVPGGKSLSGDGIHSPVVRVRLPENVRNELTSRAQKEGISVSKYTRELIEHALKAS